MTTIRQYIIRLAKSEKANVSRLFRTYPAMNNFCGKNRHIDALKEAACHIHGLCCDESGYNGFEYAIRATFTYLKYKGYKFNFKNLYPKLHEAFEKKCSEEEIFDLINKYKI